MGDLTGLLTWIGRETSYYKITSGGIVFSIKTNTKSIVGLATQPCGKNEVTIVLGCRNYVYMVCNKDVIKTKLSLQLSNLQFTKFWLCWTRSYVKLGLRGQSEPIIKLLRTLPYLSYVTFGTVSGDTRTAWEFRLPPIHHESNIIPLDGREPEWVSCEEQLPDKVMVGGFENDEPLYIVRATHSGSLTPGKFVTSLGLGFIPWGGVAHEKENLEALCGYNAIWMKTREANIPRAAVVGGFSEDRHETLFVGRAEIDGHIIPGKVQPSHGVCYIPYQEREVAMKVYEILVGPSHDRNRQIQISAHVEQNLDLQDKIVEQNATIQRL